MNLSSWFRRSVSRNSKNHKNPPDQPQPHHQEQEEFLGITQQLIDHVKSFTLETFKNFPIQDDGDIEAQTSYNVRKDLSDWQERHAVLVLSKVKELSQLRFKLCPRHLKEEKFWRIYFMLVNSYVAEYELHAIQRAKLQSVAMKDEKTSDTCAYEVEMAERNQADSVAPSTP
ncbi:BSD domain-containing family protein [Gossypium australe]|uniref:BSD domain-containing family protein n=1 Tax=Gossypium australe TaxID=47621 RepID=A0A5B6W1A5_9ROSI|nr:BSD domain-containing family protein [Gossypium australe]